ADRQPESHPRFFGRKKWSEYSVSVFLAYSGASISDGKGNTRISIQASHHLQMSFAGRRGTHCFNRVFDQVQNDQLYLHPISRYLWKIVYIFGRNGFAVDLKLVPHQI